MTTQPDPDRAPARRALLLINQKARRGSEELKPIIERLNAGGLEVLAQTFCGSDEVEGELLRHAEEADCVIVCGGDGTLNSAAGAIVRAGLPLGIMPMGTANDLARTLDIPDDLQAAADTIARGRTRQIDLGSVNGAYFFNVASIGVSADLSRTLDTTMKKRWGRLSYAVAAAKVLSRARRFSAEIENDQGETTRVRSLQISIGNGRHYGGGVVVEESASISDASLDLYSLEMRNVWKLALMIRTFRSGTHGAWSEVRTAKGREFVVRTRVPHPVYADGELVTETPARFRVHPHAVTVFVP